MLVADPAVCVEQRLDQIESRLTDAISAGVRCVQWRDKSRLIPIERTGSLLRRLRDRMPPMGTILVNEDAALAHQIGAGLHLPTASRLPEDLPACWGRSVHDLAQTERALREGARYLIAGHIFETPAKDSPARGLQFLQQICRLAEPTPVFAIGGITASRVSDALGVGAWGVSVCRSILHASNIDKAVAQLLEAVNSHDLALED